MKHLNLKNIFILIAILTTTKAWSHPTDSDDFVNIGIGSKIIAKHDINIKPNTRAYVMDRRTHGAFSNEPICMLGYEVANFDRIIRKGK